LKAFLGQSWAAHGPKYVAVLGLLVLAAVLDLFLVLPRSWWGGLFLVCSILPAVAAMTLWGAEFHQDAIRFLEYLPLRRGRIWGAKFAVGLAACWSCVLPCLVVRALGRTGLAPAGTGGASFWGSGSNESLLNQFGYLLASAAPHGLVLGGLALVFFWYSVISFLCLSARGGRMGGMGAFILVCYGGFWSAFPALGHSLGLRPNIQELIPFLVLVGLLTTASGCLLFVPFRPRGWALKEALVVTFALATIIVFAAGLHLTVLCMRWTEPLLSEAEVTGYILPDAPDDTLALTVRDRRSGEHTVVVDLPTGAVRSCLPWLSTPLGPGERDRLGRGRSLAFWVSGTGERSYALGQGLCGLLPGPARIVRTDGEGAVVAETPCSWEEDRGRHARYYSTRTWRALLDRMGRGYQWRVNGTVLLEISDDAYDLRAVEKRKELQKYRTLVRLRDRTGAVRKEYWLTGYAAGTLCVTQARLFVRNPEALSQEDGPPAETDTFILLDLATLREWRTTLPVGVETSPDLTRGLLRKTREDKGERHYSVSVFDLETGAETAVWREEDLPVSGPADDASPPPLFAVDRRLMQAACCIRRREGDLVYAKILHADLISGRTRTLVPESDLPPLDLRKRIIEHTRSGHAGAAGFDPYYAVQLTLWFTPDGRALQFSGHNRSACLFDVETGRVLLRYQWPDPGSSEAACEPFDPVFWEFREKRRRATPYERAVSPDDSKCLSIGLPRTLDAGFSGGLPSPSSPAAEGSGPQCYTLVVHKLGAGKPHTIVSMDQLPGREAPEGVAAVGQWRDANIEAAWYDGERIVFTYQGELWLINADGQGLRRLFPATDVR